MSSSVMSSNRWIIFCFIPGPPTYFFCFPAPSRTAFQPCIPVHTTTSAPYLSSVSHPPSQCIRWLTAERRTVPRAPESSSLFLFAAPSILFVVLSYHYALCNTIVVRYTGQAPGYSVLSHKAFIALMDNPAFPRRSFSLFRTSRKLYTPFVLKPRFWDSQRR